MINLTPIHKRIQRRLFEKMDILGRNKTSSPNQSSKGEGPLNHAKMATRSTFLRMTSTQINPVILMGGKVKEDGTIPAGYDDIYGSRTYKTGGIFGVRDSEVGEDGEVKFLDSYSGGISAYDTGEFQTISNNLKRPTPGVKGIDVSFKGGQRALREATINWTCWDWEELNILMPHFLAHGKTVMVEWGWVYDKKSLTKLPNFLIKDDAGNRRLSVDAFKDYRDEIFAKDGDFDMMVGIIKNFEFTTREDGGFDCTTILSSVGASILDTPQPNSVAVDPNITYNLSIDEDTREVAKKLSKATGEPGTEDDKAGDKNSLVNLNTAVSLKLFIKEIDNFLLTDMAKSKTSIQENSVENSFAKDEVKTSIKAKDRGTIIIEPNKYLMGFNGSTLDVKGQIQRVLESNRVNDLPNFKHRTKAAQPNYWVRWGWFEDNILSKFLSVTTKHNAFDPIITEFRSIERLQNLNGDDSVKYESTRIKNHEALQTTDINNHILPGQFFTQRPRKFTVDGRTHSFDGDTRFIRRLAEITKDDKFFSPFACSTEIGTRIDDEKVPPPPNKQMNALMRKRGSKLRSGLNLQEDFTKRQKTNDILGGSKNSRKSSTEKQRPKFQQGYLRNILINTKVIKQAFGIDDSNEFSVETVNVVEAIQNLFNILNQDLNFWSYNIVVDEIETSRAKIVDEQVTRFNFDRPTLVQKSKLNRATNEVITDDKQEEGVFYFPTWKHNTIVKNQNVSARIPDEMQLAIMYGSNMDSLKEFSNPGNQFVDKEGILVSGLFNKDKDTHKSSIDVAYRNENTKKIGVIHGFVDGKLIDDASMPLSADLGDDIESFLLTNAKTLEETYEKRIKELNEKLKISQTTSEAYRKKFDSSVPPPFAKNLNDTEIKALLQFEEDKSFLGLGKGELTKLFNSVYDTFGEMKPRFKDSVGFLTTNHGITKQLKTPLLIPLELELSIDGIGGIYPGNSFHSSYLPNTYLKNTVFQAFDINHRLDGTTWTTTLVGKMRANLASVFTGFATLEQLYQRQFENYLGKTSSFKINTAAAGETEVNIQDFGYGVPIVKTQSTVATDNTAATIPPIIFEDD